MSDFQSRVTKTFSDWTLWYDEHFRGWMRYAANMVLNEIKIPENPTCLDVACGTGLSTFELIKQCNNKGTFYGIDISKNMIDQARRIASEKEIDNVEFQYGDVEKIGFPDSTFDVVLCNMSIPFFPNKPKAFSEMSRVLKHGGQYAFTYNAKPHFKEGIENAFKVAANHPEVPTFHQAVTDTQNMFIDIEESRDFLEGVGLNVSNMYGRHSVNYADPSFLVSDRNSAWDTWKQALPENIIDVIGRELVKAGREVSGSRGFKYTGYIIFAWGTKQ